MEMKRYDFFAILIFLFITLLFLHRAYFAKETALPGDILIGHYYPWKDYVWDARQSGYPIKNFDLNDAVFQFFPWRKFTTQQIKSGNIPFRNPYNFLGTPHLANIATAVFYPLSFVFYLLPLLQAWDVFIGLQIMLAGVFMYIYLKNLMQDNLSAVFGGVTFALSSFVITTLEFSVIAHTLLWTPLILYSIDKLLTTKKSIFLIIGVFSMFSMFLAGFIQIALYVFLLSVAYFVFRANKRGLKYIGILIFPVLLVTFQILPFAEAASQSSRIAGYYENNDAKTYLMPANRLLDAFIPDYYGNPATGNFFGGISYTEFAFYIGIVPLLFALYSLALIKEDTTVRFWWMVTLLSSLLLVKNPFSSLLYELNIPVYTSLLPSRLLSIVTICLTTLASLGIQKYAKQVSIDRRETKFLNKVITGLFIIFVISILKAYFHISVENENSMVSLRNTVVPMAFLTVASATIITMKLKHAKRFSVKNTRVFITFMIILTIVDLTRQGWKYNSFIKESLVFPYIKSLTFLKNKSIPARVLISHQELLPSETNIYYNFSLLGGYDSVHSAKTERFLNTLNYGRVSPEGTSGRVVFTSSLTSSALNIISPEYYYILDQNDRQLDNATLVFSEGRTKLYKNLNSFPRVYATKDVKMFSNNEILPKVLQMAKLGYKSAYVTQEINLSNNRLANEKVELIKESANEMLISVNLNTDAFIVINNAFDTNWKAANLDTGKVLKLVETNYNLIGFSTKKGNYQVHLIYSPDSFYLGIAISSFSLILFSLYYFTLTIEHSREKG
jgi:hypothetical protein